VQSQCAQMIDWVTHSSRLQWLVEARNQAQTAPFCWVFWPTREGRGLRVSIRLSLQWLPESLPDLPWFESLWDSELPRSVCVGGDCGCGAGDAGAA
jgi:hypothetical protein